MGSCYQCRLHAYVEYRNRLRLYRHVQETHLLAMKNGHDSLKVPTYTINMHRSKRTCGEINVRKETAKLPHRVWADDKCQKGSNKSTVNLERNHSWESDGRDSN